jgi:PAS domain S-box-containing protein/putative nucleotidyltransferase with HDIG domain
MSRSEKKDPRICKEKAAGYDPDESPVSSVLEPGPVSRAGNGRLEKSAVLDAMAEHVIYHDLQLRIQWANRAAAASVGLPPGQLTGRHCYEIWQGRQEPCERCPVIRARETGRPQEAEMTSPDGRVWHIRGYPVRNTAGEVVALVEVTLDITERKWAERALRESQNRYRELVEDINDAIFEVDKNGLQTYVSPIAEKIHGYKPEELNGQSMDKIVHPDDLPAVNKAFAAVTTAGQTPLEVRIIARNGGVKWIRVMGKPVFKNGEFRGIRGVLSDITERKTAERRVEQLNQLREALLSPNELVEKLKLITEGVIEIFGADFARIWITRKGDLCHAGCFHADVNTGPHVCRHRDRCLWLMASSGRYTHIDGQVHRRVPFGCYKIGRVAAGQDPKFITNDVIRDERVHNHEWAKELGLVSFAGYRLLSDSGRPMGVLALFSKNVITPEVDALLVDVANSTSQVIQTANAEQELRESEEKFRSLFESTHEAIGASGPDGRIISANPAMARVLGCENPQDLVGIPAVQLYADQAERNRLFDELLANGFVENFELTLRKQDGSNRPVRILGNAVLHTDAQGNIKRADFIFSDITERKKAEEALRISEEKYRTMTENLSIGIYRNTPGPKGHFVEANPAIVKMFGYGDREEFMKVGVSELYKDPKERERFSAKMLRDGYVKNEELLLKRKDGSQFYGSVTAVAVRRDDGEVKYYDGVIEDITERKRTEKALQESEEKFRTLADHSPNMIFINKKDRVVYVNPRCEQILGYSREQFYSPDFEFLSIVLPEYHELVKEKYMLHMRGEEVLPYEYALVTTEGRKIDVILASKLIEYEGDKAILGTVTDVSELKHAQEEAQGNLERLQSLIEGIVNTISITVETRDQYTAGHQKRVAVLAKAIAEGMQLPEEKVKAIYMAALIHDIGKISIPAEILSKPTRLNEVEYSIIKTHPQVGYDILKGIEFPWPIAEIILKHHERMDGSGYPQGLNGDQIPMEARILSVADVVEAMASHRPYRASLGIGKALEEITQNKDTLYDPEAVKVCLKLFYHKKFEWDDEL